MDLNLKLRFQNFNYQVLKSLFQGTYKLTKKFVYDILKHQYIILISYNNIIVYYKILCNETVHLM